MHSFPIKTDKERLDYLISLMTKSTVHDWPQTYSLKAGFYSSIKIDDNTEQELDARQSIDYMIWRGSK